MRTIDCSLALICVFCIVGLSLGLCDFQIVEPVSCGEGVLYESETFEIMDNNTLYETLSSNLEELVIGSLSPEELKCSGDKMVVNTSTIKSCQSTLDSRYLYVIVESSSSCLDDPSLYQNSSWKATVNLITKEMDFEDLCGLR